MSRRRERTESCPEAATLGRVKESLRFALVGDPVGHSLSPAMHVRAMADSGIRGTYETVVADVAALNTAVEHLRDGSLDGLNVTMPLKSAAAASADLLTPQASAANSVNTMRARKGLIEGHSTDVAAFSRISGSKFPDRRVVLVLGSGGAAAAAASAFDGFDLYFSARDTERAEEINSRFQGSGVVSWGSGVAGALVVNATPVGMGGEQLPETPIRVGSGLIDLPYGGSPTKAASLAGALDLPVVDGVEFLSAAAAESFLWWTGVAVDSDRLLQAARNP